MQSLKIKFLFDLLFKSFKTVAAQGWPMSFGVLIITIIITTDF